MSYLTDVVLVGGKGENPFDFSGTENGTVVKKISVWIEGSHFWAIKVWLSDEQSCQFGLSKGVNTEFVFEDDEHFTSLSLWKDENGSGLAAIKFKTTHSREFFASIKSKKLKEEVSVDVGSGICIGIKGSSDWSLVSLGFMFINTIKSTELTDVVYPTLQELIPKVNVNEVKRMTYQNNSNLIQESKIESSKKIIQKSSWSITGKLEFTCRLEVKAAVPLIAEGKTNFQLKLGVESRYASETSEEKMELYSFPVKVAPRKTVVATITLGEAKVNLPFKGKVKITCFNGGVLKFNTSGTYKGVTYTGANIVVNESDIDVVGASESAK